MATTTRPRQTAALGALGALCALGLAGLALDPALGQESRTPGHGSGSGPGPGEVVGYAQADRGGASRVWRLPADQPYLYVPAFPAEFGGRLAAVEAGPEVGVALFQGPYFTARDQGCQPVLGTQAQPDLKWLGATARFAPAPPEQAGQAGQAHPPDTPPRDTPPPGGFGSMIVYRSVLGPPPGALLLERRPSIGVRCSNPVLGILYNRIFVPMAEAPAKERCFDLAENYPAPVEPFALDFLNSDRMVLLMPGDMSEQYGHIRHDIAVSLFERLSCRGPSMAAKSRVAAERDQRLNDAGFRARARSVRVSYLGGNAEAFLTPPEPAPPEAAPKLASPAPERPATPSRAAPAAEPAAEPAVRPAAAPASTPPPVPPDTAEAAFAAAPEPALEPVAAIASAPERPATIPALTAAPATAPVPSPKTETAVQARAKTLAEARGTGASRDETPAPAPLAEVLGDYKTAALAPGAAAGALGALSAVSPGGPSGARTFAYPVQDLYRLDHCLNWQSDCGKAAALAWCRARGFAEAVDWRVDEDIGAHFPTFVMGAKKVCALASCDGFKEITCAP